jgi:hypoxanthine phosphoribosyltransferase
MKKIKAPEPVGVLSLSNTAAVVVCDIDDNGETVSYYISSVGNDDMVKVHTAKIYYRVRDNEPYFNSVVGRMILSDFSKY